MVLVLVGTQNNSFERLLNSVQECVNKKIINEKVVIQRGYTKFQSDTMDIAQFYGPSELSRLQDEANLIITHGGVGSIINSLLKGKKVIVVPRLKKYHEHVNDHQMQIAKKYETEGYVKCVYDISNLGDVIKSMKDFEPKKYVVEDTKIIPIISNYIDNN